MKSLAQTLTWQIVSEIELRYKSKVKAVDRTKVTSSLAAYQIAMQIWNPNKIEFFKECKILLLNNSNSVLGCYDVSSQCFFTRFNWNGSRLENYLRSGAKNQCNDNYITAQSRFR